MFFKYYTLFLGYFLGVIGHQNSSPNNNCYNLIFEDLSVDYGSVFEITSM